MLALAPITAVTQTYMQTKYPMCQKHQPWVFECVCFSLCVCFELHGSSHTMCMSVDHVCVCVSVCESVIQSP